MTVPAPTTPTIPGSAQTYQGLDGFTGGYHLKWATQAEAIAGVEETKLVSPATLKAMIDAIQGG